MGRAKHSSEKGFGGASHDLSHYCVLPFLSFLFSLKLLEFKHKLTFFSPLLAKCLFYVKKGDVVLPSTKKRSSAQLMVLKGSNAILTTPVDVLSHWVQSCGDLASLWPDCGVAQWVTTCCAQYSDRNLL